jgi:hypothetical protein
MGITKMWRLTGSFLAAYSHFGGRYRVVPETVLLVWLLLRWF